jgi:hypothetical protein
MSGRSCGTRSKRIYDTSRRKRVAAASSGCADCCVRSTGCALEKYRVFYDVSGTTVEVLAIVAKSEAEPWLAQFGNPE